MDMTTNEDPATYTNSEEIEPAALADFHEAAIIDIRSREERTSELGYIPGSRAFPENEQLAEQLAAAYPKDHPLVLACLSGRRSQRLLSAMREEGFEHVAHLKGGMLAWQGAGLPVCGAAQIDPDELPEVADLNDLPRAIVSCFVAESVETQLDGGGTSIVDPRPIVERIIDDSWRDAPTTAAIRESLDRLAEIARAMGHPLGHIAHNIDRMQAALMVFEDRVPSTRRVALP